MQILSRLPARAVAAAGLTLGLVAAPSPCSAAHPAEGSPADERPAEPGTEAQDPVDAVAEFERRLAGLGRARAQGSLGSGGSTSAALRYERLELARWAVAQGLHQRALEQFDRLLGEQPGMPEVLQELRRLHDEGALRLGLPHDGADDDGDLTDKEFERAALHIGLLPAAGRELGALRLYDEARIAFDDDGVGERAQALLSDNNIAQRTAACDLLRLGSPAARGAAARALLIHALADSAADVRIASAVCLGADDDPALLAPLVRALDSDSLAVAAQAAEALATARAVNAVPAMAATLLAPTTAAAAAGARGGGRGYIFVGRQSAYVQDFDVEVATGSAIADPVINVLTSGAVLDASVLSVTTERVQYRRRIARALARLTDENVGARESDWERWWTSSAHRPRPASEPAPSSGS